MKRILVIDDEQAILDCFRLGFAAPDYRVTTATTAGAGLEAFRKDPPDVVLVDVRLPDLSGLETFERIHQSDPKTPVILMTGHGTAGTAIEAMRLGAFEYVLKPIDIDEITSIIDSAAESHRMMVTPARLPTLETPVDDQSGWLVGECPAMQKVYRSIGRVAQQDVTVLILGESGTGKEIIARAIYQYSKRADQKFLAINCAAIPENLLESELFGHEKGSFTGADRKRIGKFELATHGTLFLDEIGEMTPLMQTKLLRVLQDQTFERVGGSETITTNARIIAATNRDLESAIREGTFRVDLFYRLNVYAISLPPLRERGDDLPLLVNHFVRQFNKELSKSIESVAHEAMDILANYHWPGNIRELQSVVKHAFLEATGPVIVPAFLPPMLRAHQSGSMESKDQVSSDSRLDILQRTRELLGAGSEKIYDEIIEMAEREVITEVIRACDGNMTNAASRLGLSRTTLRAKLGSLGISVGHVTQVNGN